MADKLIPQQLTGANLSIKPSPFRRMEGHSRTTCPCAVLPRAMVATVGFQSLINREQISFSRSRLHHYLLHRRPHLKRVDFPASRENPWISGDCKGSARNGRGCREKGLRVNIDRSNVGDPFVKFGKDMLLVVPRLKPVLRALASFFIFLQRSRYRKLTPQTASGGWPSLELSL